MFFLDVSRVNLLLNFRILGRVFIALLHFCFLFALLYNSMSLQGMYGMIYYSSGK